jgi:hypothetical protein
MTGVSSRAADALDRLSRFHLDGELPFRSCGGSLAAHESRIGFLVKLTRAAQLPVGVVRDLRACWEQESGLVKARP